MRVIVHAGLNKTGSSAVQEYLYSVRKQMPQTGYLYPDLDHESHWKLAFALAKKREDGKPARGYLARWAEKQGVQPGKVRRAVAKAIRTASPDTTVILSHENFSAPPRAAALSRFLRSIDPEMKLSVIGYVRDPISAYPSVLQQVIKGRVPIDPPSRWQWSHARRALGLRVAFGEQVAIRAYDRTLLAGGDVVEDFRTFVEQATGRTMPPAKRQISTNTSLSAGVCALLSRYMRAFPGDERGHGLLRRLLAGFSEGRNDPKLRLPDGWDRTIAAANHEAWNGMVDSLPFAPAERQRLHVAAPDGPVPQVDDAQVDEWLSSYLDPAFVDELTAFLRSQERFDLDEERIRWLEAQR